MLQNTHQGKRFVTGNHLGKFFDDKSQKGHADVNTMLKWQKIIDENDKDVPY